MEAFSPQYFTFLDLLDAREALFHATPRRLHASPAWQALDRELFDLATVAERRRARYDDVLARIAAARETLRTIGLPERAVAVTGKLLDDALAHARALKVG